MKDKLLDLIDYFRQSVRKSPPPESTPSHNVYSVKNSDGTILFSKIGNADDNGVDIVITLNPDALASGQLLLCKKSP